MDGNRAKNLTIIFLIILNICLLTLVYFTTPKKEISNEQIFAIKNALEQNKISVSCEIPRNYGEMAEIYLQPSKFNDRELIKLFFQQEEAADFSEEFDKIIYTDEKFEKTLTVMSDVAVFENPKGSGVFDFSKPNAKKMCDELLETYPELLPGAIYDEPNGFETKDGLKLIYRQVYLKNIIQSNYIAFTLNEKGLVKVEYSYKKPIDLSKEKREIISCDEALFALMQNILNTYKNTEFTISKIDIVYNQGELIEDNDVIKTVPCYRFWLDGVETPYIINGY